MLVSYKPEVSCHKFFLHIYRNIRTCNNFTKGSWKFSRFPCIQSWIYEIPGLQWGFETFNFSRSKILFLVFKMFLKTSIVMRNIWPFLIKPSDALFWAEKRWGLLHDSVENNGSNSGIVLFIWNRYNIEVNSFILQCAFK